MKQISRRQFLQQAGGLAAAAAASPFLPMFQAVHPVQAADFPRAAVAQGSDSDSAEAILRSALDAVGGIGRFVKAGQVVAIKPNATWSYPPHTASSTDPDLLVALIRMVKEAGAGRIIVMDHCSIEPGTRDALRINGIGQVVDSEGVEGVFPDRNNSPASWFAEVGLPGGKAFQKVGVIKAALEADVRINMGVAKTHSVTRMTLALKHMMGFMQVPGLLHARLHQGIADLNTPSPLQAQLHILEALRVRLPYKDYRVCAGPETELTHPNIVKRMNQMLVGTDPVLLDSYACVNYYAIKPEELAHLKLAAESGVGDLDLDAAQNDGRLQFLTVGAALPTAAPQAEPTRAIELTSTPASAGPAVTATPLPTALPESGAVAGAPAACTQNTLIDPRPVLSGALIPAAAVIAGMGVVMKNHLAKKEDKPHGE